MAIQAVNSFYNYGRSLVARLVMIYVGSYVEGLDINQISTQLLAGTLRFTDLRIKKSALDKFDVPFEVVEGRIGVLSIELSFYTLSLKVSIEDVHLLVASSAKSPYSQDEEEQRTQAIKQTRLEEFEQLQASLQLQQDQSSDKQNIGLVEKTIEKVVNNAQVTVKSIHVRFEDAVTVPGHPFAAGITLASLEAVTTDGNWTVGVKAEGDATTIHKLISLDSLALYFNTDCESIAGMNYEKSKEVFRSQISSQANLVEHQFILKPISGQGRIIMNKAWGKGVPHYDATLLFRELAFALDKNQYQDVISLADVYHIYARQHKYRRYRPDELEFVMNRPRALLKFAAAAILEEVHDKRRRWTWEFFKERRDDRHHYVDLFKKKTLLPQGAAVPEDVSEGLLILERKLSYHDIRFYRSISRMELKKDPTTASILNDNKKKQEAKGGWTSWLWSSSQQTSNKVDDNVQAMTEEQLKGLYEVVDYDEKAAIAESFEKSHDSLIGRAKVKLQKGSFKLKSSSQKGSNDIISLLFDSFELGGSKRSENFEASLSLGNFKVFDGTTSNALYNQIVHVKEFNGPVADLQDVDQLDKAFFSLKYEYKPLDERADNGLSVFLKPMEIIYQRGYVEAIVDFLKPPQSQLQSVEALLSVATETLEGIQKETRAGLEYALEKHKTVDLRLDMHAPIIIIPESVSQEHCNHLIIDAGRVIVKSKLADKVVLREIEMKRNRLYTDEDYKELESLMYDNYEVSLNAAQFIIGENLDVCRRALQSETPDPKLHLLERVNIELIAQNTIVPAAKSIPRLKMSGRLPQLHLNFSDTKYKTLMRLLDITIPRFGDENEGASAVKQTSQLPPAELFSTGHLDYSMDESPAMEAIEAEQHQLDKSETQDLRQHLFEFHFEVDTLQVTIMKASNGDPEQRVGDLRLERFSLQFSMAKLEMKVDIRLRSIDLTSVLSGKDTVKLVSTESGSSDVTDLMKFAYRRVQKSFPDFYSEYDGFDQSITVNLSTFIFRAVPEHVLSLYDYLMTTFVPSRDSSGSFEQAQVNVPRGENEVPSATVEPSKDRIRVLANLASFKVLLIDGENKIASLALSTANVNIVLGDAMDVKASMGDLLLTDDSDSETKLPEFKHLLSIEGDNLAELRYQTFCPEEATKKGVSSFVRMETGVLKFHFLVTPLNRIYLFLLKFARLKAIYDTAAEAAVQRAAEIERMAFEVLFRAPIIVVPINPTEVGDSFSMKLGEISARNSFDGPRQTIEASLSGLQLASIPSTADSEEISRLKVIDDVTISTTVTQTTGLDRSKVLDTPDFKISIDISDVKIHLTEQQYCQLISLSQIIPGVFDASGSDAISLVKADNKFEDETVDVVPSQQLIVPGNVSPLTSLQPELTLEPAAEEQLPWLNMDMMFSMQTVKLHLYDSSASSQANLKDHGISRIAINGGRVTLKSLSDGSLESEFTIKSFTMNNILPGPSKYREIIPAASHGRNQIMVLFTMSGGAERSGLAVMTVDSPQIVFSLAPVSALLNFFWSAFQPENSQSSDPPENLKEVSTSEGQGDKMAIHYRFDLHDASIIVLENDEVVDSQAIRLSLKRISLSQQEILALSVLQLGMSLVRMDKQAEAIRFLDDFDVSLTLESHQQPTKQFTGIQIMLQPIIFRSSYRDILLIMSIANKAIALFSGDALKTRESSQQASFDSARAVAEKHANEQTPATKTLSPPAAAKVIATSEELTATLDGFRLVLIGDLHEMPMLNLETKPLSMLVTNWSTQLHAKATISTAITFWNLKNSHWEPLIDPWKFSVEANKEALTGALAVDVSSQDALDVNLTSNFMELGISTARVWSKEGDRVLKTARGAYAPYRISNRTGGTIFVWSDIDGSRNSNAYASIRIGQTEVVEWRFDDWKTTREHVLASGTNSIGIRFDNKPWEQLRSIPVDREGEYIYSLRPRTNKGFNKLMCEIVIKDNVKFVTLRSTYKVENQTFYPLEVAMVDNTGHPISSIDKIAPGEDYALPIEAASRDRIRIQPDPGFGYKWSPSIWWEDLRESQFISFPLACPHGDRKEPPFNITLSPVWSSGKKDYPQLKLVLRAPIELENLLPYDLQYRVFDKESGHNWNSYLRKGGIAPVHSVELRHLVLLSITVQDTVYKASDFTIINADRRYEFDQEHTLTLTDAQDRKLTLLLNYIKHPDAGGAFKIQIYSPYIVINKTGLPFGVRSIRSAGLYRDVAGESSKSLLSLIFDELTKSTPFMLSHYNKKGNEFIFKIGDSDWSNVIRFDVPSAETPLVIPSTAQRLTIHTGLSWSEGTGKYKLTKVIELSPRFIVYNKLTQPVCFREHGSPPSGRSELQQGERCSLQAMRNDERKLLTLGYPGLDAHWSPPIDMEAMGTVHVRMRPAGSTSQSDIHLLKVDVILEKATVYIVLSPHEGSWPFVVENESDFEATIGQTDESREHAKPDVLYRVKPHSRLAYAWDFPAAQSRKIYLNYNRGVRLVDIMEIGVLPPLKHRQGTVSLDVRAEGKTQVLTISTYREETSLYKLRRRGAISSIKTDASASSQDFEVFQEEVPPSIRLNLDLRRLAVSLVNRQLVEVVYLSVKGLKVEYSNSPVAQSIDLSFGELQVDNQLHDAHFPVVLEPTPLPRDSRVGALPTLQTSIIILNDNTHGVLFVKYASILLQAITVQIDEAFLYALMDLAKLDGIDWEAGTESVLVPSSSQTVEPVPANKGQDVYFEVLELQPIRLSVSFVRNVNTTDEDAQKVASNPLATIFNIVITTLANAEGIDLKLNALGLKDIRLTVPDFEQRIILHYRQEVLRQIYRVIGSADFLGNPVGLFTNVSSGVADIFYEPWNGVVQHGGGELGLGIAKGAASFVKKTVFGVSDSVTKLTSTIGKGLTAVTFDAEYQTKRQMAQRRNKPRHALMGFSSGAEAFANAITSGVEGLITKPVEGAESQGTAGFLKGIGKGVVGFVAKPAIGIADFASNVSEGIRNTTTVFDQPQRDRVRKPRLVPVDGVLQPYSIREALGQFWMRDLLEGKYRKEFYIAHIDLPGSDDVVLLTNARILKFTPRNLNVQMDMPLTTVAGVQAEHTGILFTSKLGRESNKSVIIQDRTSKDWFFEKVKAVVISYNAKRRLER